MAASSLLGRTVKLRRAGRKREALAAAQEGLAVLHSPLSHCCEGVSGPAAHSTQAMLAIHVEQLSEELGTPGVGLADLAHVIGFLSSLPPNLKGEAAEVKAAWLPYFERRLAILSRSSADAADGT